MSSPPRPLSRFLTPTGITQGITLALAVIVVLVLVVGGVSLALAVRIDQNNEAVAEEYAHILVLDQVHSVFDDLIFELQQMDATGSFDRTTDARLMYEDLIRRLDQSAGLHRGLQDAPQAAIQEEGPLSDLRRMAEDLRALAQHAGNRTRPGRLERPDLDRLNNASREVPHRVEELASAHRMRVAGLLQESRGMIRAIVSLYLAFVVVSGFLVALAGVVSRRTIAVPLGRLSDAAFAIAQGRLDSRVRVESHNEIGQLSQTFNVMADGLQMRQRDLQAARDELEQRVREVQALYRIGTEISRLHQPDRILQSVVDKARELLRCEAAVLCLCGPGADEIVARATSGPPEAFRPETEPWCGRPLSGAGYSAPAPPCPVIEPAYLRAHLGAVLRLGDLRMGEIHVSTREARDFTAADAELLDGLATQAAIALERRRLSEEVQSLATVQERERIAREMHDGVAQALGLLHMKLKWAQGQAGDLSVLATALREMATIAERTYEEVRQSIFGLRTLVSRGLGLVPTLTEYLHEFSAQNGIAVDLEVAQGPSLQLPPASEVQAIRIIQEALSNVRKHASASRARVRLQREGRRILVTIEDDGVGWELADTPGHDRFRFGLQTMRERAESLGGTLQIDTTPGRGTRIVAALPGQAT